VPLERRGSGAGAGAGAEAGAGRLWGGGTGDTSSRVEAEDTGFGAEAATYPRKRLVREAHEKGTSMRCTPVRCTPMRCTPMRCTPVRCMPVRYMPAKETRL